MAYYYSRLRVLDKKKCGNNINGPCRRENGEGVASGTIKENGRCNDIVEKVDKIEVVGSRKRKRQDSESPFCRALLGVVIVVCMLSSRTPALSY